MILRHIFRLVFSRPNHCLIIFRPLNFQSFFGDTNRITKNYVNTLNHRQLDHLTSTDMSKNLPENKNKIVINLWFDSNFVIIDIISTRNLNIKNQICTFLMKRNQNNFNLKHWQKNRWWKLIDKSNLNSAKFCSLWTGWDAIFR